MKPHASMMSLSHFHTFWNLLLNKCMPKLNLFVFYDKKQNVVNGATSSMCLSSNISWVRNLSKCIRNSAYNIIHIGYIANHHIINKYLLSDYSHIPSAVSLGEGSSTTCKTGLTCMANKYFCICDKLTLRASHNFSVVHSSSCFLFPRPVC